MKTGVVLKWVNPILFLLFLITGVALVLYKAGPESLRWSESMHALHEGAGTLFILTALFHVFLNRGWINAQYFKKK